MDPQSLQKTSSYNALEHNNKYINISLYVFLQTHVVDCIQTDLSSEQLHPKLSKRGVQKIDLAYPINRQHKNENKNGDKNSIKITFKFVKIGGEEVERQKRDSKELQSKNLQKVLEKHDSDDEELVISNDDQEHILKISDKIIENHQHLMQFKNDQNQNNYNNNLSENRQKKDFYRNSYKFYLYDNQIHEANVHWQVQYSQQQKKNGISHKNGHYQQLNLKNNKQPMIISTDIGGTLVGGDPKAITQFNKLYLANFYFDKQNSLIYNSGRSMTSYRKAERLQNLVRPDYFISRCGVIIYKNVNGTFIPDEKWTEQVKIDWNFQAILDKVEGNLKWLNHKKNVHDKNLCLKFQCKNETFDKNSEAFYEIEKSLHENHKFQCIVRTKETRKCIDFIPIATNKGKTLQYLCENEIKLPLSNVYAFGDTMNDCDMLEMAGIGVLVKNSMNDAVEWLQEKQKQQNYSNSNNNEEDQINNLNEHIINQQNNNNILSNGNGESQSQQQQLIIQQQQQNGDLKKNSSQIIDVSSCTINSKENSIQKSPQNKLFLSEYENASALSQVLEQIISNQN